MLIHEARSIAVPDDAICVCADRLWVPAVVNPPLRSALQNYLSLDGEWDFAADAALQGELERWYLPETPLPNLRKIDVPGCWEAQGVGEPGLSHAGAKLAYEPVQVKLRSAYTGAAWYRKRVTIPSAWRDKQIWLKLGGANCQGWVWVNGTCIGHNWAYCGTWKCNITDLVAPGQEATVAVLVRNDVPSRRGESNCVRPYGGLSRSVELEATPAISIDYAFAEPLFDQAKVRLHITLRNTTAVAGSCTLQIRVTTRADNRPAGELILAAPVGAAAITTMTADVDLDPFIPWSPEYPFLYHAEIVLRRAQAPIDGWVERFGVKKYEVRGSDMYLNNARFFVRGCSENHVYPATICSPASLADHVRRLKIVKDYGFNYVRMHTHCENPEYFDAADEMGIMIQAELPYYGGAGDRLNHMSCAPQTPKEDLHELVFHYRRYPSLAVYSGGNEALMPSPLGQELYALAKSLDPSRPWLCLDGGGNNTPENSEVNHYGYGANVTLLNEKRWPHVRHEFASLGIYEDPRLEPQFTQGLAPNQALDDVKEFVTRQVGLDWKWAEDCFNAGNGLQAIWHKILIESARIDPRLDGFIFWLMVDMAPSGQCGILDTFWGRKRSSPETFRQFNAPTVICARAVGSKSPEVLGFDPATLIHTEGDTLEVDWVVSYFQTQPLKDAALSWQLIADGRTMVSGRIEKINVAAGTAPVVGRSRIVIPAVSKAVKAVLEVNLESVHSSNAWDIWIYPKFHPQPNGGEGMAASPRAFDLLAGRYPGLVKLDAPQAGAATLIVAGHLLEPGVPEALDQGKRVICLSLPGYDTIKPGTTLSEWASGVVGNQAGTAIAAHPAFGDFPHGRFLDQGLFRLVDTAEKLDVGHKFRNVQPLMVGIGRRFRYSWGGTACPLGFNLYVFQAQAGNGKLLASGLNIGSETPEAVYLLDQFIRYARSSDFQPKGSLDIDAEALLRNNLQNGKPVVKGDKNGCVSLRCSNPHLAIRYTIDGSEPNETSPVYEKPFPLRDGRTVKARTSFEGRQGQSETVAASFGCDRSTWRIVRVSHESPCDNNGCAGADKLLDNDPATYWHTFDGDKIKSAPPQEVILDMNRPRTITAFTFLPYESNGTNTDGTPDRYEYYISADCKQWTLAAQGEFADIKNTPGMRLVQLEKPISGRFIRFVATHVIDDGDYVLVAGIGAVEARCRHES